LLHTSDIFIFHLRNRAPQVFNDSIHYIVFGWL